MKNIVLIGFMGTGKTSMGKMLAARLGFAFIDLDQKIEEEEGRSIPEIFEAEGEAYFRECERQMVARVAGRRSAVISTGGGTVKDAENLAKLKERGIIVCLTANIDTILARTSRRGTRPMLDRAEGARRQEIERLLKEREAYYSKADYFVDTSEWSPIQIVEDIVRHVKRRKSRG